MGVTSIEWTDCSWSVVRGCSRVSEGCRNCYAERIAVRFSGPGQPYEGFADVPAGRRHSQTGAATCGVRGKWTGRVELIPSKLDEPLRWKRPRRVFVNSMSDLFHEALPDEAIDRVFGVMAASPRHTFQVLTKRPARMLKWATRNNVQAYVQHEHAHHDPSPERNVWKIWPLPNVWLGVSVEDQATADERIPLLLQTPAAVRFISVEPMLEQIDLCLTAGSEVSGAEGAARGIHWVIVGGESGPGARPFDIAWARSVIAQCREAGVACFYKQAGCNVIVRDVDDMGPDDYRAWDDVHRGEPFPPEGVRLRLRSPKGGDPSEWPEELRVREFPR